MAFAEISGRPRRFYSPEGTPVEIVAGEEPGRIVVRVIDHGSGVPMKERERIFDKYYRLQSARQTSPGTGLGLALCRRIVEGYSGRIWVESILGEGATFCLTLRPHERQPADLCG